jgi:hypothetical protein
MEGMCGEICFSSGAGCSQLAVGGLAGFAGVQKTKLEIERELS